MNLKDLDRATIVARKLVEAKVRGENEEKWKAESTPIVQPVWEACYLSAINAAIWQRQDQIRDLQAEPTKYAHEQAGGLAFDLLKLNDWRAEIIGEEKFK